MMILKLGNFLKEEKQKEKALDELIEVLLKIKNKDEMRLFLKGMLTHKELVELPSRLTIVKMLKKGISQQEIAGKLGVGVATVTRGSKEIQMGRFKNV